MKRPVLIIPIILFITLTVCFLSYASDNVIYGCYKKNGGQLRIVNNTKKCLPSEVPISFNLQSSSGVKVYDANDQYLGVLVDEEGTPNYRMKVFVPSLSRVVSILYADGEIPSGHLYFSTNDCSGVPYGNPSMRYQIFQTNDGRYFISEDSQVETITIGSMLNYGVTCWRFQTPMTVIPLKDVTTLFPFSLPVTLPLRFEYGN